MKGIAGPAHGGGLKRRRRRRHAALRKCRPDDGGRGRVVDASNRIAPLPCRRGVGTVCRSGAPLKVCSARHWRHGSSISWALFSWSGKVQMTDDSTTEADMDRKRVLVAED